MQCLERLPALTAISVLEFVQSIQSDIARKGKGMFSSYSEQLKQTHSIPKALCMIKQGPSNKLTFTTDWEHLNTRICQAETSICHKFQLMQTILSNEDMHDISSEVELLHKGILDTNNGVLCNLSIIHQLLVGQIVTNPTGKGLLDLWSTGIYDNVRINLMSAKRHQACVDKYLDNAAILQFKGILLFSEANTNSRFSSLQLDLFEHNLKYQIKKKEKTVPIFMKYLIDPDEKKGFYLRPTFDGKDEPFVISQGLKKRIGNDYMCGHREDGMWFFKKSPNFDEDGGLLISGSSMDGKTYFMSVSDGNIVKCVEEKNRATSFDVIPLDFEDDKLKISICKSTFKPEEKCFLGNNLTIVHGQDDREFTLSFD
ncbi:Hypothetical predicted protein [Mytilus galloprovincialis]|nr:Hypothetical predicted protein [Mytilus galloprovincialis]